MNDELPILRTYKTVWKIDRKIYSFQGIKLWFPISINEAIYILIGFSVSMILTKILPFYNHLNFFIRNGIIPFAIMKFLTKQKLDGKLPHKFFYDYLMYLAAPKKYARFQPVLDPVKIRFGTPIVYRSRCVVNKTEQILKKK